MGHAETISFIHSLCRLPRCHRVSGGTIISFNRKPVFITLVCNLKCRVLSVSGVAFKVLQVNSQHDVISGCQTVKIVISKPELAIKISTPILEGRPAKVKINRAVQASLKNSPLSTVRGHVTQYINRFAAIWSDGVHSTGCEAILKELRTVLGSVDWKIR